MNRQNALFALIAIATVWPTLASANDTVYVSERNGAAYHAADCQRLRFPTQMSLTEAKQRYQPCLVCQGKVSEHARDPAIAPSSKESTPVAEPIAEPTSSTQPDLAPTCPVDPHPVAVHPAPTQRRNGGGKSRWLDVLSFIGQAIGLAGTLCRG